MKRMQTWFYKNLELSLFFLDVALYKGPCADVYDIIKRTDISSAQMQNARLISIVIIIRLIASMVKSIVLIIAWKMHLSWRYLDITKRVITSSCDRLC